MQLPPALYSEGFRDKRKRAWAWGGESAVLRGSRGYSGNALWLLSDLRERLPSTFAVFLRALPRLSAIPVTIIPTCHSIANPTLTTVPQPSQFSNPSVLFYNSYPFPLTIRLKKKSIHASHAPLVGVCMLGVDRNHLTLKNKATQAVRD